MVTCSAAGAIGRDIDIAAIINNALQQIARTAGDPCRTGHHLHRSPRAEGLGAGESHAPLLLATLALALLAEQPGAAPAWR